MAVDKRYNDLISGLLERVMDDGCAHVIQKQLRRWYGRQRLTSTTWRDLEERWQEITDGEAGQLHRVWGSGGYFFLRGDKIKLIADEADEE